MIRIPALATIALLFVFSGLCCGAPPTLTPPDSTPVQILTDKNYFSTLLPMIQKAQKEIRVSMFLFKTTSSPKNRAATLVNELIRAKKRGVAVHVLLEDSGYEKSINTANTDVAARLRHGGVDVRFDSKKRTNHTKVIVIDQRYIFTGSHNLTHSALATNHEFSVMIDSMELAKETIHYLKSIEENP